MSTTKAGPIELFVIWAGMLTVCVMIWVLVIHFLMEAIRGITI